MNARRRLCVLLALSLLANVCSLPANAPRLKRQTLESSNDVSTNEPNTNNVAFDDENDDDFDEPTPVSGGAGGGSSIFSLLSLLGSILPSSSSSSALVEKLLREFKSRDKSKLLFKRNIESNNVELDYINDLKPPPFLRQEESSEQDNDGDTSNGSSDSEDGDNTGQESLEDDMNGSKENSDSNDASAANDSDYDSDEPPGGGDGQGGGLLGLLAGLSGGEDGQSDLGSLLATVSGIIANLSGDGIDLNALIASGIGLFVGLLSEGEENPGTVIASYLLTSLDTITGGGSKNNGAFFGNFLSKLIKGTSAGGDPDASSEEGEGNDMKDSAGFVLSFLMSLSGDMSKGSSASH